jgi:hypothetical protein
VTGAERVAPAALAQAGGVRAAYEPGGSDDADDRAKEVELEDITGPKGAGDDSTDQRSPNAQQHGQPSADALPSRQHEPGQNAGDDPDYDQTQNLRADLLSARDRSNARHQGEASRTISDQRVTKMLELAHSLLQDNADHVAACRRIDGAPC